MLKPDLRNHSRYLILFLLGLAFAMTLLAPHIASTSAKSPSPMQQELQRRFRKYELAQVDTQSAADAVRRTGKLSIATPTRTFDIDLVQNDLRAPNYRAEEVIDGGITRQLPVSPIRTYRGTVRSMPEAEARFTIDDSTVEGLIITPADWFFIEQAQKYSPDASEGEYLVYRASDVVMDSTFACGTTLKERVNNEVERLPGVAPEIVSPMRVIEIATEADFDYVNALGGSVAANNEILSIMNSVQGIYETQLGLSFTVVFQHTWDTAADPYNTTGSASPMLQEFTDYWNANFAGTARDTAHLWTARSMDAAGIAWLGVVCGAPTFSYGLSTRTTHPIFRVTVPAHEIGHNLGANHSDGQTGCNNTIMQATATGSTTLNFCQFSVDEITNYVNGHSSCLAVGSGGSSQIQFSSAAYSAAESANLATLTLTRTGNTGVAASVDFSTSDGSAQQRSDYTVSAGTVTFAAGETSKTITVLISNDVYDENNETVNVTLSNPVGAAVGNPGSATLTITDDDTGVASTNPLDNAQFFVRQHYYDFLNRDPDPGGLGFWSNEISSCGSDQNCVRQKRVTVSNAFFYELEFQQTGAYVYRLYRAAYGNNQPNPNPDSGNPTEAHKIPSYAVFVSDRARVVGGSNQAQAQLDLANAFVQRPEFLAVYPSNLSASAFVDALLNRIASDSGANLSSQRTTLINLVNQSGRGTALYRLADDNTQTNPVNNRAFIDAEYNRSFVYTQYCGYLRRDADTGGFLFWLGQVNQHPIRDASIQSTMVCAFITSAEYQQRFSPAVTHSNSECGQ
jgi:hypothetical protein